MMYQEADAVMIIDDNSTRSATSTNSGGGINNPLHFNNNQQPQSLPQQRNTSGGFCSSMFCCNTSSSSSSNMFFTCTTLHLLCNTIFIIGLIVMVVLLGIQVHTMEHEIQYDEELISDLKIQIENQNQNQEHLNQRVNAEHSLTLYQMAGTFTLLSCLITAFHITQHLSNYNEPVIQRKIIAILWMSPIYSITSFLSLVFTSADEYLTVIKDCYEAYTIYTFLSFLIAVLGRGDRNAAIQVLACHADHLHPPTKCLSSLYFPSPDQGPMAMAGAVLTECQILALQFVLVRPITSILSFVADTINENRNNDDISNDNTDHDPYSYFKSPNFYIAMITNISVFFAFNGLLKFYHAVRDDLKWCQPFNKFLSIKSIVFLTFWQGLLISIIVNFNHNNENHHYIGATTSTIPKAPIFPTVSPAYPMYIPSPTIYEPPTTGTDIKTTLPPVSTSGYDNSEPTTTSNHNNSTSLRYKHYLRFLDDPTVTTTITTTIMDDNSYYNGDDRSDENNNNSNNNNPNENNQSTGTTNNNESNDTSNNDNSNSNNNSKKQSNHERANQIQNFIICFEMLFFSIGHWCVFSAEEWKSDYRPKTTYAKPGFGISDFAQDISDIVRTHHRRRRHQYDNKMNTGSTAMYQKHVSEENHTNTNNVIPSSVVDEEYYDDDDDDNNINGDDIHHVHGGRSDINNIDDIEIRYSDATTIDNNEEEMDDHHNPSKTRNQLPTIT